MYDNLDSNDEDQEEQKKQNKQQQLNQQQKQKRQREETPTVKHKRQTDERLKRVRNSLSHSQQEADDLPEKQNNLKAKSAAAAAATGNQLENQVNKISQNHENDVLLKEKMERRK